MLDGFFEFAEDDSTAGFRLSEVQVYNWGTFHNKIVTLNLMGKNSLLTGDIGSGKSTLVDAITTLLVPSQRVAYNKAAGADFKERSLRSYVMGYYKSERSDGGYATKPVPLREVGTTHSVILGVFYNQVLSQYVSLAQVFYQKDATGQPDRFFIVADRVLSIKDDLSNFGKELSTLKRILKKEDAIEVYQSFPEYGAAFRRRFGLKNEQALELFHQTVSLKTVGNLTSFVQDHMLEPFDAINPINNLIQHFEDLDRSHNAILRAKSQIQTLSPLVTNLDRYQTVDQEVIDKIEIRDELKYYFAERKRGFLTDRLDKELEIQERENQKLERVKSLISSLQSDRDEITKSIAANGGARLELLYSKKESIEKEKNSRLKRAEEYTAIAKRLGLSQLEGIEQFFANQSTSQSRMITVIQERNEIESRKSELDYNVRNEREEQKALIDEINSLKERKSNIDRRQIEIRRQLCSELSIKESLLPFIGELLAVSPNQSSWEGAIERVMRSFALTLLIPDSLYKTISQWVDSTHLRGRLVYYRVTNKGQKQPKEILPSSIINKLMIKKESIYSSWLEKEITYKYWDLLCCENIEEFNRVSRGLTQSGQIKGNATYHEKDDRFDISDKRIYVLGWINRAKIAELERLKSEKDLIIQNLDSKLLKIANKKEQIENQVQDLKTVINFDSYEELDWKTLSARIEEILSEIQLIESHSDILQNLQERLSQIKKRLSLEGNEQFELLIRTGKIESRIEVLREQLVIMEQLLQEPPREIETICANIENKIPQYLGEKTLSLERCDNSERLLRDKIQTEIDTAKKRLERVRDSIISAMADYNREYPTETREMDPSIDSGKEYRKILEELSNENLPKFEEQFKVLLNENTIREIAGFQARLNKEHQQIKERVAQINKSLHEIDYNKDRYILLEAMNTNDVEIRTFRQDLKSCVEGSLGGEINQQYSETKFLQVKSLINRFKGREGYSDLDKRWKYKVTDVRNWFAFAASERWREDDEEYEHYTDSGGKSGGQKEKLAYTVLGASLAYQFGLEWKEVRSRSFRFVVIDEAFGRGSDESAHYGLDLFKRLNLQLLIVTPLQKIHIIEPYVFSVGFVHNPEGKESVVRTFTIEEYKQEKEKHST
ncbi:MAG: ATP-dependent exonuclease SbcCD, C subunit-like protein [Spirochaetia bacterium]|nr:ATP-dependent exonuclease SbcCD, C subunit-like protein [Spirochaetia bacterium]